MQVSQSGLGMPDRDYYLRNDERFAETRKAYTTYIARLFALANQPDPEGAAARIVALETKLAEKQWDRARNRDRNATYNKIGRRRRCRPSTPHFDWQAYLAALPADAKDKVNDVIVRQPDYLKAVDAILAEMPVATWKEYLTFGLISAYADGLSAPFADSQFEFNGRVIAGRQEQQPRWKRGVTEVEQALGEPVGRLYVEKHFKPEAKARMDALIRNLLAAFKVGHRRARVDVAGDQARGAGQARQVPREDRLSRSVARLLGARDQARRSHRQPDALPRSSRTTESWARLGKPVERWRWGFTPQTVNASYSATNNEITFPAGILQPPFFDVDADDAINYGAIGAVIGHEISHGFDDQGRKSDGDGNLRDWWTAGRRDASSRSAPRSSARSSSPTRRCRA